MNESEYPVSVQRYLRKVAKRLSTLPANFRREILDGVSSHIGMALEQGTDSRSILTSLGTPEQVANEALNCHDSVQPARYLNVKRVLQLSALIVATGVVFASKLIVVQSTYRGNSAGSESFNSLRLFDLSSPVLLVIPILLTLAPLFFRGRGWQLVSIISTLLLILYAAFAPGHSGLIFAPVAFIGVVALFFPPRQPAPTSS